MYFKIFVKMVNLQLINTLTNVTNSFLRGLAIM